MGWMMHSFIVAWAVGFLFVQNVHTISGAQPACFQLSARGSSAVDLPRSRMSGTVPLLLRYADMACAGTASPFTMLLFKISFDP